MNEQLALQNILRTKFAECQRTNPRYSLRAFSSKVGVHVGALTYIINGKRNVSRNLAERITRRLLLDPQERSEILGLFPDKKRTSKSVDASGEISLRYLEMSASQYKIVAEWEHLAVMSLVKCSEFQNSTTWIAKRLGISETRASQVVDRLIELKLLTLDENAKLTRSGVNFRTSDDIADTSIKRHHDQTFDLARDSLHRDPVQSRDFTSITVAVDPKKISMAKELIRKFQDELSDLLESGHQTEVYRLSMQLFPLTKQEEEVRIK